MQKSQCCHFVTFVKEDALPKADVCQVCGIRGPLRMRTECGFVGCCESTNSHDSARWKETGHPIIKRMPLASDSWLWCYEHKDYLR